MDEGVSIPVVWPPATSKDIQYLESFRALEPCHYELVLECGHRVPSMQLLLLPFPC